MSKSQKGFTLIELAISIIVIGLVLTIFTPLLGFIRSSTSQANYNKESVINKKVALALVDSSLSYRRNLLMTPTGTFQTPFQYNTYQDSESIYGTVYAANTYLDSLNTRGITATDAQMDNSGNRFARFYLVEPAISIVTRAYNTDFYGYYDWGAVWLSHCKVTSYNTTAGSQSVESSGSGTCVGNPAQSLGSLYSGSGVTRINNIMKNVEDIYGQPAFFSTYDHIQTKMQNTFETLKLIRDRLTSYIQNKRLENAGNSASLSTSLAPDVAAADPLVYYGGGCDSGWHDITIGGTGSVLQYHLGLANNTYGKTAFGNKILYCSTYNTGSTKVAAIAIDSVLNSSGSVNSVNPSVHSVLITGAAGAIPFVMLVGV